MEENKKIPILIPMLTAGIAYCLTHIMMIYTGEYTCDEGNYLYSSSLVMKGLIPYKDFAFWQPPAILYYYGPLTALTGHSLEAARWISFLTGFVAFILMAAAMLRKGNRLSCMILLILISLNLSYAFDTANVKTQSLSILLYALPVFLMTCTRTWFLKYILSSIIIAAAAGTRASLLPAALFFPLYVYFESGRDGRTFLLSALTTGLTMTVGFAVFYILSNSLVLFGLLGFFKLTGTHSSVFEMWYIKDLLGNQAVCYSLLAAVVLCLMITKISNRSLAEFIKSAADRYPLEAYCLAAYVGVCAVHFLAPVKYATHQTTNMPLMVMFIALCAGRFLSNQEKKTSLAAMILILMLSLCTMPFQQYPVDKSGGRYPLSEIREVVNTIRPHIKEGGKLFTFETILAYEGGFELLPGLTIGVENHFGGFGMNTSDCKKYKGVDNSIIQKYFKEKQADLLVMQAREIPLMKRDRSGVTIDQVMAALHANYKKIAEFDKFGQFKQKTYCFVRKD